MTEKLRRKIFPRFARTNRRYAPLCRCLLQPAPPTSNIFRRLCKVLSPAVIWILCFLVHITYLCYHVSLQLTLDYYNPLTTNDFNWCQYPWDLGSAPAERAGREEVVWVHLMGANSMAASGPDCRKVLVGTGWAISLLLCMNRLRKQSGDHWLRAMTIENSLVSGCG